MNTVALPDGLALPSIGLGSWRMGESARQRAAAVAAVRLAIEIGYRVIDAAEMYGEGGVPGGSACGPKKAVRESHPRENFAAAALTLTAADLAVIDRRFQAPRRKLPLAMR